MKSLLYSELRILLWTITLIFILITLIFSKKKMNFENISIFIKKIPIILQKIFYTLINRPLLFIFLLGTTTLIIIILTNILYHLNLLPVLDKGYFIYLVTVIPNITLIKISISLCKWFLEKHHYQWHTYFYFSIAELIIIIVGTYINYRFVTPFILAIHFTKILSYFSLNGITANIYKIINSFFITSKVSAIVKEIDTYLLKTPVNNRAFFIGGSNYDLPRLPNAFAYKPKVHELKSISRFSPINIAGIVDYGVSSVYTVSIRDFKTLPSSWIEDWVNQITDVCYKYSNFHCRINLVSNEKVVCVNTTFTKGYIENFNIESYSLDFVKAHSKNVDDYPSFSLKSNNYSSKNYEVLNTKYPTHPFYLKENIDQIKRLTDPGINGHNLQVNMTNFPNVEPNLTTLQSSAMNNNVPTDAVNDFDNNHNVTAITSLGDYSSIIVNTKRVNNEDVMYLNFNPNLLYLDDYVKHICIKARSNLISYYAQSLYNTDYIINMDELDVNTFPFYNIFINNGKSEDSAPLIDALFRIDHEGILPRSSNINLLSKIYPFSYSYIIENCNVNSYTVEKLYKENFIDNFFLQKDGIYVIHKLWVLIQEEFRENSSRLMHNFNFPHFGLVCCNGLITTTNPTRLLNDRFIESMQKIMPLLAIDDNTFNSTRLEVLYENLCKVFYRPLTIQEIDFLLGILKTKKEFILNLRKANFNNSIVCVLDEFELDLVKGRVVLDRSADLSNARVVYLLDKLLHSTAFVAERRDYLRVNKIIHTLECRKKLLSQQ